MSNLLHRILDPQRRLKPLPPLTADRLRSELEYDSVSGLFCRRVSRGGRSAGSVAGYVDPRGYVQISVGDKSYWAHRLAWFYVHGAWPTREIDHINGDRSDNRLANLREVNHSENQHNTTRVSASSGLLGVHWHQASKKWLARITVNRKCIRLGLFDSKEKAHQAYLEAKAKLHPSWSAIRENVA